MKRLFVLALIVLTLGCGGKKQAGESGAGGDQETKSNTVVFIVPGTYGNTGLWPQVIPGKATFGSELKRAAGPKTKVIPFLWRSSVHHTIRTEAATNLARQIKEKTRPTDRIVLVGHSHGGNVALLAAGQCSRKIDMVVCLSTPHIYQNFVGADKKRYALPVYCPLESYENIQTVLTLTPSSDNVPARYAQLRVGVTENEALHATRSWREKIGNLTLADDGGVVQELIEDLVPSSVGDLLPLPSLDNLALSAEFKKTKHNFRFYSMVKSSLDQRPHHTAHSRRLGAVVGELIRSGATPEQLGYLRSLTQRKDADNGEPVAEAVQRRWRSKNAAHVKPAGGWRLQSVEMEVTHTLDKNIFRGSEPDPYFQILSADGKILHESPVKKNTRHPKWNLENSPLILWGEQAAFALCESHLTGNVVPVGILQAVSKGPNGYPKSLQGKDWSAKLRWVPVHL